MAQKSSNAHCKFLASRKDYLRANPQGSIGLPIRQADSLPPPPPPLPRTTVALSNNSIVRVVKIPIGKIPIAKIPIGRIPSIVPKPESVVVRPPKPPPHAPPPYLLLQHRKFGCKPKPFAKPKAHVILRLLKQRLYAHKLERNFTSLAKTWYDVYDLPQEQIDRLISYFQTKTVGGHYSRVLESLA
jgi:hypothetical protein